MEQIGPLLIVMSTTTVLFSAAFLAYRNTPLYLKLERPAVFALIAAFGVALFWLPRWIALVIALAAFYLMALARIQELRKRMRK